MVKRFFTVEQARDLLPAIRKLVEVILALSGRLEQNKDDVQSLANRGELNSGSPVGTNHVDLLILLEQCIHEIEASGCVVKSVEEGLVDFPHLRGGREVYLCWKYDESDIQYWHELDAGFAGRTPLE